MKKSKIITNIYGYAVCLTAIIVFIICISQFIFAVMNLNDPIHSGWNSSDSPSLASFENYKADILESGNAKLQSSEKYVPDNRTLHKMYKAAVKDKIALESHRAYRELYVSIILIIMSAILFLFHWRWMRKRTR
ncbi:MAG: hypothetical protein V1779_03630 [bacterium]